jgi:tripartite-type tricarboxylate transporter receptor subunit TctC
MCTVAPLLPRLARALLAPALLLAVAAPAQAQPYPAKAVRLVVPFPPGSGADITTRLFAPRLSEALAQPVVVENRAGAAGNIGAEAVARAAPDGYTLLVAPASVAIGQTLFPKLAFDLVRDFQPVAMLASVPFVLVVHPSLPVKSVKDLVAFARARPGQVNYASTGNGSSPHLTGEMLKMQARLDVVHVPYKGTPQAVTDLLTGQVSFMFANALSVLPQVNAGRLRALAVTSARRSAATPQLPTVAESGLPGFESGTWFAVLAPAGAPREAVAKLNGEIARLTQHPDIREKLAAQGAEAITATPEQTAAHIRSEIAKWGKVVKASGAKVD